MKTKTITLYTYDELPTEKARQIAREWWLSVGLDEWWESTEDAVTISLLKITSFDIDRGNYIKGASCDTYKIATTFLADIKKLERALNDTKSQEAYEKLEGNQENEREELRDECERALLEEYLSILRKEYEYQTNEEVVAENIRANEYTFTETGKRED